MLSILLDFHDYGEVMKPAEPFFYDLMRSGRFHRLTASFSDITRAATDIRAILSDRNEAECDLFTIIPLSSKAGAFDATRTLSNRLWQIRTGITDTLKYDGGFRVNHRWAVIPDFNSNCRDNQTGRPADTGSTAPLLVWQLDRQGFTDEVTDCPFFFTQADINSIEALWRTVPVIDDNDWRDKTVEKLTEKDDHYIITSIARDVRENITGLIQNKTGAIKNLSQAAEKTIYTDIDRYHRIEKQFIGDFDRALKEWPLERLVAYAPADCLTELIRNEFSISHTAPSCSRSGSNTPPTLLFVVPAQELPLIDYCRHTFRMSLILPFLIQRFRKIAESSSREQFLYSLRFHDDFQQLAAMLSLWMHRLQTSMNLLDSTYQSLESVTYEKCDSVGMMDKSELELLRDMPHAPEPKLLLSSVGGIEDSFKEWLDRWHTEGERLICESRKKLDEGRARAIGKGRKCQKSPPVRYKEESVRLREEYDRANALVRTFREPLPPHWERSKELAPTASPADDTSAQQPAQTSGWSASVAEQKLLATSARRPASRTAWLTLGFALFIIALSWLGGTFPKNPDHPAINYVVPLLTVIAVCAAYGHHLFKRKRAVVDAAQIMQNCFTTWIDDINLTFIKGKEYIEAICAVETVRVNLENLERSHQKNLEERLMVEAHKVLITSHIERVHKISDWFKLLPVAVPDDGEQPVDFDYHRPLIENLPYYAPSIGSQITSDAQIDSGSAKPGGIGTLECIPVPPDCFGATVPPGGAG